MKYRVFLPFTRARIVLSPKTMRLWKNSKFVFFTSGFSPGRNLDPHSAWAHMWSMVWDKAENTCATSTSEAKYPASRYQATCWMVLFTHSVFQISTEGMVL